MSSIPTFTTPMEVQMIDGEVVITGPDGMAAVFTPQAAVESAHRLLALAAEPQSRQGDAWSHE